MGKGIMKMQKGLEANEQAMEQAIEAGKKQTKTAERMEQIPTFYNMGITSPEVLGVAIAEALEESKPIHKGTISTLITNIKETQPDRLTEPPEELPIDEQRKLLEEYRNQTAQKQTEPPQTTQKPQTAPEPSQAEIPTPKEEKTAEKANTRAEKQTFSFRAEQSKIENWKLYAETIGTKDIGTLWTAAIDEYISNHELTADQQAVYDLKKKAAEIQRNQK